MVEIGEAGQSTLVSSCTYLAVSGLKVRTASPRVLRARRMVLELLLASCPHSTTIQHLASVHGVHHQRFRQERERCVQCGRCVRVCTEQLMADAIGFRGRGEHRSVGTPFDLTSEVCQLCGGCLYVCPVFQPRCTYLGQRQALGGLNNSIPQPCVENNRFRDMMFQTNPCADCGIGKG